MNAIPSDLRDFDFVWSACALEHLGSLRRGLDFILNSLACLKRPGLAVHTTEFNVSSDIETVEEEGCSVYRKKDILWLLGELPKYGATLAPLNLNPGSLPADKVVDIPPYSNTQHLKLQLQRFTITSIGLVIRKG